MRSDKAGKAATTALIARCPRSRRWCNEAGVVRVKAIVM